MLVFAGVAASTDVLAQTTRDPAGAGSAFARGKEAMKRGDVDAACELFAESVRLDPAPGARLNLAACDEQRNRLASASQEFKDALLTLPAGDSRIAFTEERIAALEPRVPKLVLRLAPDAPAGTTVLRDGIMVASPSLGTAVPVDPRTYTIVVRAPGRQETSTVITLDEAERKELVLDVGAAVPLPAPAPDPAPARSRSKALPIGLVSGGAVALAAGTVLGVLTLDRASTVKAHCTPGCDDAGYEAGQDGKWMSVASPVALGVGVALVAAGIYFFVERTPSREPRMAIATW